MSEAVSFKLFSTRLPLSQYRIMRVPLGTAKMQDTVVRTLAMYEIFKLANQRNKNAVQISNFTIATFLIYRVYTTEESLC